MLDRQADGAREVDALGTPVEHRLGADVDGDAPDIGAAELAAGPVGRLQHQHVVAGGDAVVAPRVTRRLLDRFAGQFVAPGGDARLAELTAREREVLLLVAQGLTNLEVADRLVITEATVKAHVGRILTKLDLRDRVQAVVYAYRNGLVV